MKYAIVTGGARGLGLGIVRALLADKVVDRIAVIDRALAPAPADVADRVEGFNGDVTDETQIHAVVETITAKFGPASRRPLQQRRWRGVGMVRERTRRRMAQRGDLAALCRAESKLGLHRVPGDCAADGRRRRGMQYVVNRGDAGDAVSGRIRGGEGRGH